jgi:hypothetical protein
LVVKKYQTKVNEADIEDVLATGSIPQILKFMKTKNILPGGGGKDRVSFSLS